MPLSRRDRVSRAGHTMRSTISARLGLLLIGALAQTPAETRLPTLCSAMEAAWRSEPGETTIATWPTKLRQLGLSFPAWRVSDDPGRIIALRTAELVRLQKRNKDYAEKSTLLLDRHRDLVRHNKEDLAYSAINVGVFKDIRVTRLGMKVPDISKDGSVSRQDWHYNLRFDIPGNDESQFIDGVIPLQAGGHWYLYDQGGALYDLVIWKQGEERVRIAASTSAFCAFKYAGERN